MRQVATDGPHTRAGEVPARSPALPVQVRAEIYEPVCPAPDLKTWSWSSKKYTFFHDAFTFPLALGVKVNIIIWISFTKKQLTLFNFKISYIQKLPLRSLLPWKTV